MQRYVLEQAKAQHTAGDLMRAFDCAQSKALRQAQMNSR
jgi:hypothetical protein